MNKNKIDIIDLSNCPIVERDGFETEQKFVCVECGAEFSLDKDKCPECGCVVGE